MTTKTAQLVAWVKEAKVISNTRLEKMIKEVWPDNTTLVNRLLEQHLIAKDADIVRLVHNTPKGRRLLWIANKAWLTTDDLDRAAAA